MTTKILTFRVPVPIYSSLCSCAAEKGVSVSAYIRRLLEEQHQADQVNQLRLELLARFESLISALVPSQAPNSENEEILLLSRAIAAHLSPQLVSQVRARLTK